MPVNDRVGVGRISGLFGIRGWVKVFSYTSPRANVVKYSPWILKQGGTESVYEVLAGHGQGDGVVASLAGIDDRDAAAALVGAEIEVERAVLGPRLQDHGDGGPGSGEFFWVDLQGMQVVTVEGVELGTVDHLFETGSNDVMVIVGKSRHLVPFLYGSVVRAVDGDRRVITVDWDPEF